MQKLTTTVAEADGILKKLQNRPKAKSKKEDKEIEKLKDEFDKFKQKYTYESARLSTLSDTGLSSTLSFSPTNGSAFLMGTDSGSTFRVDSRAAPLFNLDTGSYANTGFTIGSDSNSAFKVCPNCGDVYSGSHKCTSSITSRE